MAMNTRMDLLFWGATPEGSKMTYREIAVSIEKLERLISRYHPKAELYQVNQRAYQQPLVISAALFDILEQCFDFFQKTEGYFDISLGKIYHEYKHHHKLASDEQAAQFKDRVLLNREDHSIILATADIELDLGGIGKGIALEQIAQILSKYDIQNAFISFGGSSILTRGRHPHGDYWPFSLSNEKHHFQCPLNDDSISVSQSLVEQTNSEHIIDPKTHAVVDRPITVIVKAKNPIHSEVLSTTLVAAPPEQHASLARAFRDTEYWVF